MAPRLLAATDVVAIGVTVVATLVVVALVGSLWYLLSSARQLRRETEALTQEAHELLDDLDDAVLQAGAEVDRVDRLVGSAEAISDAVGSASRVLGGALAEPVIKLVALASGIARVVRAMRGDGRRVIPATSRERERRRLRGREPDSRLVRDGQAVTAEPGRRPAAFGRPRPSRSGRGGFGRHLHALGTSSGSPRRSSGRGSR